MASRRDLVIRVYAVVVVLNYIAVVAYAFDLYGQSFSRPGALLLGATLAWFLIAYALFLRGSSAGRWLLLAYVIAQVVFYLKAEIIDAFVGAGLPYQLTSARDPIVFVAFMVGALNGLAAIAALIALIPRPRPTTT